MRNNDAKTVATKLFNDYVLRFRTSGKILHDQGREIEIELFTNLSKLCNIKALRTTPYHPQCNDQNKRTSRSTKAIFKSPHTIVSSTPSQVMRYSSYCVGETPDYHLSLHLNPHRRQPSKHTLSL